MGMCANILCVLECFINKITRANFSLPVRLKARMNLNLMEVLYNGIY